MSKINNYKDVKKATKGDNYYGHNAHLNSVKAFKEQNGRRPTMEDAQTLRDMAEERQNHWDNNAFIRNSYEDDND